MEPAPDLHLGPGVAAFVRLHNLTGRGGDGGQSFYWKIGHSSNVARPIGRGHPDPASGVDGRRERLDDVGHAESLA